MSSILSGTIKLAYPTKAVITDNSSADGGRLIDQIAIEFVAAADEAQYTFNLTPNEQTPALERLQQWRSDGTRVMVFCSSLRATPYVHDTTTKDKDGKLKSYPKPGKKVAVTGTNGSRAVTVEAEIDAFISLQAYDIQPAGTVDVDEVARRAHGAYLAQREQYLADVIARKQAKSLERAQQQLEAKRAKKAATVTAGAKKSA